MERLKIEEIANNYGMHLKDFAQRKVLADQINFVLDFGMEYYQDCFYFWPILQVEIFFRVTKMKNWIMLVTCYGDKMVTKHHY